MDFISGYCTDAGAIKRINQDSLCIKAAIFSEKIYIMAAICDGMGGLSNGETASAYVINGISQWFEESLPELLKKNSKISEIRKNLDTTVHVLNDNINSYSSITGIELGTTLSAILFLSDYKKLLTIHIGDSRIYKITEEECIQLTHDHSVVYEDFINNIITEEEAKNDSRQNQLTKCIGAGLNNVSFDYSISDYSESVYMICSDGFRKKLSTEEIKTNLSPSEITDDLTAEKILRKLTDINIERNEIDNISALLIKIIEKDGQTDCLTADIY